ncbi:MAG: sugar kinase [Acidobacteria bacterium]|nr:sugar kinase [Acidobacteriota bacterium]
MTDAPIRLACIGDVAWDIMLRPESDLVWGSDVFGAVRLLPGGCAANVAVWARRLGAFSLIVGKVADDDLGSLMITHLEREGVRDGVSVVHAGQTARIGVVVHPGGERAFVTDHHSLLAFTVDDLPTGILDRANLLFLSGYGIFASGSAAIFRPLLHESRRRGIAVAFDPSSFSLVRAYGANRLLDEVGPVDFLFVNEAEAASLQPGAESSRLLDHARMVIVKRGANGATAHWEGGTVAAPADPVTVVDTTGAGDAFDAGFLVEYGASGDLPRALAAGNRLGAYVCAHLGAQPRLRSPSRDPGSGSRVPGP